VKYHYLHDPRAYRIHNLWGPLNWDSRNTGLGSIDKLNTEDAIKSALSPKSVSMSRHPV